MIQVRECVGAERTSPICQSCRTRQAHGTDFVSATFDWGYTLPASLTEALLWTDQHDATSHPLPDVVGSGRARQRAAAGAIDAPGCDADGRQRQRVPALRP